MDTIHKWLIDNRITEVEVLVPDMTGNARGKFVPADKFMKQESPRRPEGIRPIRRPRRCRARP